MSKCSYCKYNGHDLERCVDCDMERSILEDFKNFHTNNTNNKENNKHEGDK